MSNKEKINYFMVNYGFYVIIRYKKDSGFLESGFFCIKVNSKDFNIDILNLSKSKSFHLEPICDPKEYGEISSKIYPTNLELIEIINDFKNNNYFKTN